MLDRIKTKVLFKGQVVDWTPEIQKEHDLMINHYKMVPVSADVERFAFEESCSTIRPLEEVEDEYIMFCLKKNGGKKELTAKLLGIDRKTLYRRIARYEARMNEIQQNKAV